MSLLHLCRPPRQTSPDPARARRDSARSPAPGGTDAAITDATITDATITDATITDATITDATITDATITDETKSGLAGGRSRAGPD